MYNARYIFLFFKKEFKIKIKIIYNINFFFQIVISKKRLEADKSLAKNLEEKKTLEIENAHKKENVS